MNVKEIKKEKRSFRDLTKDGDFSPDTSIVSAIDSKSFPISSNKFFGFCPQHLANKEWERCLGLFNNRLRNPNITNRNFFQILMMQWQSTVREIDQLEAPFKDELKSIAEDVVREIYQIDSNDVNFNADIKPHYDNGFDSTASEEVPDFKEESEDDGEDEEISKERQKYIVKEAQKRIIMNGFAHGSAVHIWKTSYYIAQERLNELSPDLIEKYNKYSALVSFLMWMFPVEQMKAMIESGSAVNQGWNKVGFKSNKDEKKEENKDEENNEEEYETPVVTGVGMNFPVLIHELSKGVVELISYHGIPQDLSFKELQMYYQMADEYTLEPWFYFLAPTLWSDLVEAVNFLNEKIESGSSELDKEVTLPEVLQFMCSLEYEALSELCIYIVHDKEKAISRIELMMEIFNQN